MLFYGRTNAYQIDYRNYSWIEFNTSYQRIGYFYSASGEKESLFCALALGVLCFFADYSFLVVGV